MSNTLPVIMYPEGLSIGKVKSWKDSRSKKVRHVAFDHESTRIGTFDTVREAKEAVIARAREEN